jgi:hypothetical protein
LDHPYFHIRAAVAVSAIAPVRQIDARKPVHIDVDRARQFEKCFLTGDEGRFERLERMVVDMAGGPVAGVNGVAKSLGKPGLMNVSRTGPRTTAVIGERLHRLVVEILIEPRIAVIAH